MKPMSRPPFSGARVGAPLAIVLSHRADKSLSQRRLESVKNGSVCLVKASACYGLQSQKSFPRFPEGQESGRRQHKQREVRSESSKKNRPYCPDAVGPT